MKKHTILILTIIFNYTFSQNNIFIYEYKFIPDSTNRADVRNELMILNIQKDKSEFYSSEMYNSDSTMLADSKKGIMTMPSNKVLVTDRVVKNFNSNEITHISLIPWDKYNVKNYIDLKWNLKNEFSNILNYNVQKATTEFGGRKWIAWFSHEIPIQDGPYKFRGLPRLIMKIEDSTKSHCYELKGIRKNNAIFIYPDLNNNKEYTLNYDQYVKVFKNYRKNPTADLIGKIPDQRDANGNFRSSTQILKEIFDKSMERFKKDNNIIELNLLK